MAVLISLVFVVQKKSMSDLNADITTASNKLKGTSDLTKMLTVQNQLRVLPDLHGDKAKVPRIFDYITQSTPDTANISRLHADFVALNITISGSTDSLETVNTFTDTLKFTTYHTKSAPKEEKTAFSKVVLASFGRDSKGAAFTINFNFDPAIFSDADEVTLTVPNKITTRSQTEQPTALFQQAEGGQ